MNYQAYVVSEKDGAYIGQVQEVALPDEKEGFVVIKVAYSSLNFKDALSNSGNKGVTRKYPHTPGIDAAGTVHSCADGRFNEGDQVVVTGYDLGMNTAGGFGEFIQVPVDWVVPLNKGMSLKEAMAWGTAGLTAALCIEPIVEKVKSGKVIVSGSTGGVGSIAVKLLSKLGYEVCALTRKHDSEDFLKSLGAVEVLLHEEFLDDSGRPMLKPGYAAAVDVAGGATLETILKVVDYQGVVSCCGLVDKPEFHSSIFPFILRGITLAGIDSVELPLSVKEGIWAKLSTDWKLEGIADECTEIQKEQLSDSLVEILKGKAKGRYILAH